jgi:8-oxo-dGTP pyrophosphatase MutT (NUDIX family)
MSKKTLAIGLLGLSLVLGVLSLSQSKLIITSSSSSSSSSNLTPNILDYDNDRFDGVLVYFKENNITCCKEKFNELLDNSLKEFKNNNRKGIWLKLPINKIDLTSVAISKGFELHSCEKEYLMLTKWLQNTKSTIPNQPHNSIGIGCICYDKKNKKILVVKEKNGGALISNLFKIPTGAVDPLEDLHKAAIRELKEETGIDGKFIGIMGIRHLHGYLNGKSDLFFICVLEPLTFDITIQEDELIACEWLSIDDYFQQDFFKGKPLQEMINRDIKYTLDAIENNNIMEKLLKLNVLENVWRPVTSTLYSLFD